MERYTAELRVLIVKTHSLPEWSIKHITSKFLLPHSPHQDFQLELLADSAVNCKFGNSISEALLLSQALAPHDYCVALLIRADTAGNACYTPSRMGNWRSCKFQSSKEKNLCHHREFETLPSLGFIPPNSRECQPGWKAYTHQSNEWDGPHIGVIEAHGRSSCMNHIITLVCRRSCLVDHRELAPYHMGGSHLNKGFAVRRPPTFLDMGLMPVFLADLLLPKLKNIEAFKTEDSGSSRRIDIIAINKSNMEAEIIDPTIRFEINSEQPLEVDAGGKK
ncbi:hypothetical protein C0J52_25739 [Blattella germanica]|nr:hypothetical protein C0J52_25739 [Blattella germanica]